MYRLLVVERGWSPDEYEQVVTLALWRLVLGGCEEA
jgi:hypothetical protein